MEQGSALGKNFFVHVAGKTGRAHEEYVRKLQRSGQSEVFDPKESDYIVVFCPVASRVGTDIGEALADVPGGKPIILVVMHHTFDRDLIVAESRRQVNKPEVLLTVDCLFHEGRLLTCNRNDIAWGEIKKTLGLPTHPAYGYGFINSLGKNFFVQVAGKTGGAHKEFVGKLKRSGQNEVNDPDQSDYIVVFCPVASQRVGTDIGEALGDVPDGKPIILVVMHHTFDRHLIVAESRRQVNKPEVLLTVDCLFHEGRLLTCNRNDIAWGEIKKTLGLPTHPAYGYGFINSLGKNFFVRVAGKTGGAHKEFVGKLKNSGQNEVNDPDQSDYIVVFCPVASQRVGTDIGEALGDVPGGKPIILVVMHHTFDRHLIVAESRRQVNKPEVLLTVDCLFHEGRLLTCNRNDIAWGEIKKTLGLPTHPAYGYGFINWLLRHQK